MTKPIVSLSCTTLNCSLFVVNCHNQSSIQSESWAIENKMFCFLSNSILHCRFLWKCPLSTQWFSQVWDDSNKQIQCSQENLSKNVFHWDNEILFLSWMGLTPRSKLYVTTVVHTHVCVMLGQHGRGQENKAGNEFSKVPTVTREVTCDMTGTPHIYNCDIGLRTMRRVSTCFTTSAPVQSRVPGSSGVTLALRVWPSNSLGATHLSSVQVGVTGSLGGTPLAFQVGSSGSLGVTRLFRCDPQILYLFFFVNLVNLKTWFPWSPRQNYLCTLKSFLQKRSHFKNQFKNQIIKENPNMQIWKSKFLLLSLIVWYF